MAGTFTKLTYHIVHSTKYREPLITPNIQAPMYEYIGGIIRSLGGSLIEIGGIADHVHLAVRLKATPSLSDIIKTYKAKTSKWLNQRPDRGGRFAWQTGYSAFTVSESQLPRVVQYIQGQEAHHRGVSFRQELIALLDIHGIEYDEKYLFD